MTAIAQAEPEYDITVYNDRDSWLAGRKDTIGASESAAAMSLSPYQSRYALWSQKCGLSSAGPENRAMRRGNVMEPFVASEYALEKKRELVDLGRWTVCRSRRWPHLSCTPDRIIRAFDDRGDGLLEIKAVTDRRAWAEGVIPEHYRVQVLDSLAVLGLRWGVLCGYVMGTDEIIPVEIARNEEHINVIVEETRELWEMVEDGRAALARGVQPMRYPDPDGSQATADAIRERYAKAAKRDDIVLVESEEARALELEWANAIQASEAASERLALAKSRVMFLVGDRSAVRLPGGTLVTWKPRKDGVRVLNRYEPKENP